MRELKFRAWDEENKKFYYSDIFCFLNENGYMFSGDRSAHPDYFEFNTDNKNLPIEQYTGLKDKNGVEIYEWDVVSLNGNGTGANWKVIFSNGCFNMVCNNHQKKLHNNNIMIEVIGNIHENKKLLESI